VWAASAQTDGSREPNTAAPAPAKKKSTIFRPTKDQITQVQTKLKSANLYSGEATGKLSDPTRDAIKTWQGSNGLKKTGTLNRATLEKMEVALTDTQKAIPVDPNSFASAEEKPEKAATLASTGKSTTGPKRPAPFRASTDQIKAAQKVLRDGKMLTGGEDGKLDDTTRDGLGKFQEANSLKVTKTLNAVTLEKMGIALTDKQKEQVAAQAAYDAAKAAN
jgi:peptidoglycan hydrolase-like protein with peptidoglycan-binding domain